MTAAATNSTTARTLGYAGVLPFLAPAAWAWADTAHATMAVAFAGIYALAIICFLCGSWWGMARNPGSRATLLLSNVYLLLALALYLLAGDWWPLTAAMLIVGGWLCERNPRLFPVYPRHYRGLRARLSLAAAASLVVVQAAAVHA